LNISNKQSRRIQLHLILHVAYILQDIFVSKQFCNNALRFSFNPGIDALLTFISQTLFWFF